MNPKDSKYQVKIKNGDQYWRDANGNIIHDKDSDGFETWRDYDANGREIHYRNSNGNERWFDINGKKITKKKSDAIHNPSCEGKIVDMSSKLAEALRPFCGLLQDHQHWMEDDHPLFAVNNAMVTMGDLRKAVAILNAYDSEPSSARQ